MAGRTKHRKPVKRSGLKKRPGPPRPELEGFDRQVTADRCFSDEEMDALIAACEADIHNATVGGQITDPSIRRGIGRFSGHSGSIRSDARWPFA